MGSEGVVVELILSDYEFALGLLTRFGFGRKNVDVELILNSSRETSTHRDRSQNNPVLTPITDPISFSLYVNIDPKIKRSRIIRRVR